MAVDLALWVPLYNAGGDFVSARVGNYQFSPTGSVLFDQMWVQSGSTGSRTSPSPMPSVSTVAPTTASPSPLEGTWATRETTCAEQNAAIEAAGFTAEQLTLTGWSPDCGTQFTIIFEAGKLLQFADGGLGWADEYRIVDEDTFEAGDFENGCYITYHYAIDGDQLTIDMVEDICPAWSETELLGDSIIQTEIYETSPFTQEP